MALTEVRYAVAQHAGIRELEMAVTRPLPLPQILTVVRDFGSDTYTLQDTMLLFTS